MANFPLPLMAAAFLAQQNSNDPLADAARLGRAVSETAVGGLQLLKGETPMVDMQTILQSMAKHRDALSKIGEVNKAIVLDALAAAGITRVNVTFDGEGDSGQIDNIVAYKSDDVMEIPETTLTVQACNWDGTEARSNVVSMTDAIERLCYDFLEQEYGGWENNDGAYGEFTLNVADRTVELEFNGRYTDIATTTHSF
jgi:hypothetical protein